MQAGMQANKFANVIDHTGNITDFNKMQRKVSIFPQDSKETSS